MTFDSLSQKIESISKQKKDLPIKIVKDFNQLCVDTFTDAIDLSKGNPQEYMTIMKIITFISEKISPSVIDSGEEKLWFILSKVAIELLMFNESNTFADAVLKFNKNNKMAWYHKGRYFEREKNFEDAEESFNKAKEIDPEFYVAWYQIASMYEKIDLEQAYQKYLKIVERFPRSMSGWKRLEEVGGKLGHYEVAMRAQKVSFELSNDPNRKM